MGVSTKNVDGVEDHELDFRALAEYLTVLDDGDVRARAADGLYTVTSQSGKTYLVEPDLGACECKDNVHRDRNCKHIRRVKFATGRREVPEWINETSIDPQLGIHVDDVQDGVDRGRGVETDGGRDLEKDDLPPLHVGDHVQDREDPDATILVFNLDTLRADAYDVGTTDDDGEPLTVADFNPEYPATDDVVEVIYPQRTDLTLERKKKYAFPRARLELVAPIHDRDGDEEAER